MNENPINITAEEIERLKKIEEKQKERYKKQNEHTKTLYDRINFTVPIGKKKEIEEVAKQYGISLNNFISKMVLLTYNNNALINNIIKCTGEMQLGSDESEIIQISVAKGTQETIRRLIGEDGDICEYFNCAIETAIESDIDILNGRNMTIDEAIEKDMEDMEDMQGTRHITSPTQAKTAQISPAKEEREEITAKPVKSVNRANKEPFDIYAVQAELDARREEVKAHKDSGEEPEEVPEPAEDIPDELGESDELTDRLNAMKAYRKQVVEEREKYGEASDDLIKDFVEKVEKEGEDITSPEYQERIREAIGAINLNRINEYLKSIGKM